MFGKRDTTTLLPEKAAAAAPAAPAEAKPTQAAPPPSAKAAPPEDTRFNEIKVAVFNALLDAVDLKELSKLSPEAVREELTDIISEIVNIKRFVLSAVEQQHLVDDICNDILGLGPARAARRARRHRRHHGERLQQGLYRDQRQDHPHRRQVPRQRAADEHLPAHRQRGRPPRRRGEPDLRRAPRRRQPRQRHRAAARDRRRRAHHPQVQEGKAHAREARRLRHAARR